MSIFNSIFGMTVQQLDQVKILEPIAYKKATHNKNVQLIDVRTHREFKTDHIKTAVNVDVFSRNFFLKYFKKLEKDKPVYLYCRSGRRSQSAAKLLVELGFKKIYDLKGGYLNWKNK